MKLINAIMNIAEKVSHADYTLRADGCEYRAFYDHIGKFSLYVKYEGVFKMKYIGSFKAMMLDRNVLDIMEDMVNAYEANFEDEAC